MVNLARWLPSALPVFNASGYGKIDVGMPRAVCTGRGVVNTWIRGADVLSLFDGKVCTRCGEWKSLGSFAVRRASPDGLAIWCRPCNQAYQRIRYQERRSEYRSAGRAYYLAHAEETKQRTRDWYVANPERRAAQRETWLAEHRDTVRAIKSKWKRANPQAVVADFHRRKARKIANGGSYTVAEWQTLCAKYGHRCLCCGDENVRLTVDHVVPVASGGLNSIENLQPLCQPCNSRKNNRTIDYRPQWESEAVS